MRAPSTRQASPAKGYRFDARLTEHQKSTIQRAADLEGRSMTDFVIQSAQNAAEQTIHLHSALALSERDSKSFVEAILNPRKPGRTLRAAASRYKRTLGAP